MDENLAVIYEEMISLGILNHELAHAFSELLFTHKLICKNGKISRIVILQRQLAECRTVTPVNQVAYVSIPSREYCILMFDSEGNCYAEESDYEDIPLMEPERYLKQCMQIAPDALPYLTYYFSDKNTNTAFADGDGMYFPILMQTEHIQESYKAALLPEIIRYYERKDYDGMLERYLSGATVEKMSAPDRRYVIELLIESHMYEKAYPLVQLFGYDYLGGNARVTLCSFEITEYGFEEDDFLLGLADAAFTSGKYNDVILIYLCKFYNGPTKHMAEIWKAAGKFEIDTYDLEERIITQMLYSTDFVEAIDQIYENYCSAGGKELVCMAYLSYFANSYLVHDTVVPAMIFEQIEQRFLEEKEMNDACKLSLLKFYAEADEMNEQQIAVADRLLLEYTCREMYFSFYKKLDRSLVLKYHLYDKFFVEYHTTPGIRVVIDYSFDGMDYVEEDVNEVYDGIYVREFILFFGEAVQYYLSEIIGKERPEVTESNQLGNNDIYGEQDTSKYALINEMLVDITLQEQQKLKKCMKRYHGLNVSTEEIFRLL